MRWSRSIVPARVGWCAALAVGLALPQPSGRAQESPPRTAEGPASADVTTQFRFSERYQSTEERSRLDAIGPYRVAIRETIKTLVENPQAAPDRDEWTTRAIFIERPAELSGATAVSAAVR